MTAGRRVRIVRYAFRERLLHALTALSYVYLLLTGLAFWTPALYWIAAVLGGGYLSRVLHPWVGLIFSGALLWMFVTWRTDMRVKPEDRAWRSAMRHYMRNEDAQVPAAGRFNFGQKQLFWLMVLGGVALLLSGARVVVCRLHSVGTPRPALRGNARACRRGARDDRRLHHPSLHGTRGGTRGLNAIVHGEVTEEWARHHHALWLAQVQSAGVPATTLPSTENDARSGE